METQKARSRMVTWDDPSQLVKAAAGRTGLEVLRDIFEGRLAPPPIAVTMGFRGIHVEEGKAVFEGEPGEHLYNPIGVVHGGFAMTARFGDGLRHPLDAGRGRALHDA
jgi:hypothetical protein